MANLIEVEATDGQMVFDLPFVYSPGSNELFVFWQGQLLFKDVGYTETTSSRVTLLFAAQLGDIYTFRIPAGSFTGILAPEEFSFAPRLPRPEFPPTLLFSP